MRIGVVVDSSCDLPPEFMAKHGIKLFPNTIRVGGDELVDERDPDATLAFFESHIGDKSHDALTTPFTVERVKDVFLERLVLEYDFVFCIAVWSQRSRVFENATKASFGILSSYRKVRKAAGVEGPFSMRVIDSKTLFAGVGLIAAEVAKMAEDGMQPNEIRAAMEQLVPNVVAYMVPADLAYIRQRATQRGEKSVGAISAMLAGALDIKPILNVYREKTQPVAKIRGYDAAVEKTFTHLTERVRGGDVISRHLTISYGGPPQQVEAMPGYVSLHNACRDAGIDLVVSIMSATAAVIVGDGCISFAYAGTPKPY